MGFLLILSLPLFHSLSISGPVGFADTLEGHATGSGTVTCPDPTADPSVLRAIVVSFLVQLSPILAICFPYFIAQSIRASY